MFTRCPDCQKAQSLTVEQLRNGRGMMRCAHCSSMFDALLFLSENEKTPAPQGDAVKFLRPPKNPSSRSLYWSLGLIMGLLMLAGQVVYFEGDALIQTTGFRQWAEKLCGQFHCQLPDYRNIDEFEVLHRSLTELPDHNYELKIVFNNQAAFRQPYPNITLTLLNFDGSAFAQRRLFPKDYLSEASNNGLIEAEATAEISLDIAAPKTKVGGFDFDFTF